MTAETWGIVGARGSAPFEHEGREWTWARCHAPDCAHFVCVGLSDTRCWVHADGLSSGAEFIESLRRTKADAA